MISEAEQNSGRVTRLERRVDRERRARQEAESLLEAKSLELYNANCHLTALASVAERDPLTALANRLSFARDLDQAINSASDEKRSVHLLLIDLDRFSAEKRRPSAGWAETSLLSSAVRHFTGNAGATLRRPSPRPWAKPSIITGNSFPSLARSV